ncbi:MAG: hypothetical protein QXG97_03030, partial [Nitrososphaerota archaeon]
VPYGGVVTPELVYGDRALRHVVETRLLPPAEPGDRTVPIRSSDQQLFSGRCRAVFRQTGYEHQDSYKDGNVLAATLYSIIKIALEMKWSECPS